MKKNSMKIGVLVSSIAIAAGMIMPASAMEIKVTGDPCTLNVYSSQGEDATVQELGASDFFLYGTMGTEQAVVKIGETVGFVDIAELASKLPEIPIGALADGTGLADVNNGASGDTARDIQQKLTDLGYLTGTPDGMYGGGTAAAVKAFQEEHGLTGTGNADVYTQLTLTLAASGVQDVLETTYPTVLTPESKFENIMSLTDADLTRYVGPEWRFTYDTFEKFGLLDPQIVVGTFSDESSDINRISLTCSLKVVITENAKSGRLEVTPCLVTESQGAYRPYLQSAILAAGGQTVELTGGESKGALNGVTMSETGYVPLTAEALTLLASGTLDSVRISGMNNTYDITNTATADQLSWFGTNA